MNDQDQVNMQNEADSTKIAVINANIQFMQRDLATINLSIKELASVYVTRENLADVAKLTEAERTPFAFFKSCSITAAHEAQSIPLIFKITFLFSI